MELSSCPVPPQLTSVNAMGSHSQGLLIANAPLLLVCNRSTMYVRYWRKAAIGLNRAEWPLLTQSGHCISPRYLIETQGYGSVGLRWPIQN